MRKLSLALVFTSFAFVACGGGATSTGADNAEAGRAPDGSTSDLLRPTDSADGAGGSSDTDGTETNTLGDSATADMPERRDLAQSTDGPSEGADGMTSRDAAADVPTTTLPPGPCQGTCGATCTGTCIGKACLVTTADGKCASSCDGWCDGTCSGSCIPLGQPCTVQGVVVPDGQSCPSSDTFLHVCDKGTCKVVPPDGACPLPSGTTYNGRSFLAPGEPCSSGGVCRGGACCNGCWTGTKCVPGDTPEGCGTPGTLCQTCPAGACFLGSGVVLSPGQACASGGTCRGGACCKGCWDGTQCLAGDAPPSCGTNGALCESCPGGTCFFPAGQTNTGKNYVLPGERCPAGGGTCRAASCCQGCWNGTECLAGNTITACGTGGAICEQCGWSCTAVTGQANNPCNGTNGRTSVIAYQPMCAGTCTHVSPSLPTCCGFEDATATCSAEAGCK